MKLRRSVIVAGTLVFLGSLHLVYTTLYWNDVSFVKHSFSDMKRRSQTYFQPGIVNMTNFWSYVKGLVKGDTLYPNDFEVTLVIKELRHAKILHADVFHSATSLKWMLTLEGGQKAIFKIKTQDKRDKLNECNYGCEHPEYEVVGFTINRMFDLRNMPFVSGRRVSWFREIHPVATPALRRIMETEEEERETGGGFHVNTKWHDFAESLMDVCIKQGCCTTSGRERMSGNRVCFNWKCWNTHKESRFCFDNGEVTGAMIYYMKGYDINIIESSKSDYHRFHLYGIDDKRNLERLPGDKRFCRQFRRDKPYDEDFWFLDIIDISIIDFIMSHDDSRHTFIGDEQAVTGDGESKSDPVKMKEGTKNSSEPLLNVIYDYGAAIRTRLYNAMIKHSKTFKDTFETLTDDDPLHPLLLPWLLDDMGHKFEKALAFVKLCIDLDGKSDVLIDV